MVEKLIANMDENYETTKNESRDSVIGLLQLKAAEIFPTLAKKHANSFFWNKEYFAGEKVNETELKNSQIEFSQFQQSLENQKENTVIGKTA